MERYFVDNVEYETYDDAWADASDAFWNNGDFESFWRDEVDGREVLNELARLGSPLYENLLDAMCDRIGENITEVEIEDDEEEEN